MASVDESFDLEVHDDAIIVTFSGTTFSAIYRKPSKGFVLTPTGFSKEAHATAAQIGAFLSVASHLATEKARALGWIT